jgi:hypothetical protein
MSEWQPIETAPRDGSRLLFWDSAKGLAISGSWHIDGGRDDPGGYVPPWAWWVSDEDVVMWDSGPDDAPSHWMPLREPPNA